MADDLRARARQWLKGYGDYTAAKMVADLVAEVDRLTAERDAAEFHGRWATHKFYAPIINRQRDEIERLRELAAALEAELADT